MPNQQEALAFITRYAQWAELNFNPWPTCKTRPFLMWDCCDFHRGLKLQSKYFHSEAEKFSIRSKGRVLGALWISDFCERYRIPIPPNLKA